ncbi:MAG TPA: hypothetical protein VME68_16660 [Acidobacteriaceae bacterium]|nr:hypothetical protein [Acidobacteriaceae bacterium]
MAAGWLLARARMDAESETVPEELETDGRRFRCEDAALTRLYASALATLRRNLVQLPGFAGSVLPEGSEYPGIWMECGPQEGLVYRECGGELPQVVARNNHLIFFALQREGGELPYAVKRAGAGAPGGPAWSQIQMVVPIAATAWEIAERTSDSELLERAYAACGRWDAWLRRYRNTRGTGLCEGFCTWDTGMDNSPRWSGEPNSCADGDARKCPAGKGLPRLCPDLSATVYGGRVALAAMAKALGRRSEADHWTEDAEAIRRLIVEKLYDPNDVAFYDLDAHGQFVRVRSAAMLRVLGEHVPDAKLFEVVWERQVHNPHAFWAPYPFPSVALDDPAFVRPIPRNSWGGASQALTALRAPRWMEHYGKSAELAHVMERWVEALRRAGEFHQQVDPVSGDITADDGGYSPAALVLVDFLWRLSGVREQGNDIEWNLRPPATGKSRFAAKVRGVSAELAYDGEAATMILSGQTLAKVTGVARVITSRSGALREAVGIADGTSAVTVLSNGRRQTLRLAENSRIALGW